MRLLITGGSSYLGQHLVPLARQNHTLFTTFFSHQPGTSFEYRLDIRDATAVSKLVSTLKPDVIIHTAGSNRGDDIVGVIEQGALNIVQAAEACGARLIHLSTDVVFDGRRPPYTEDDVPTPLNEYGRAKANAEAIVCQNSNHVIVRTSLIYGLLRMDHGTEWMARTLRAGQPVTLFTNQIRNPVWADSLSRACLELAGSDYCGILHIAGRQALSRADFALRMFDWWRVAERETLLFGHADGTQWPLDCTLDCRRATAVLKSPLPGIDEVLAFPKKNIFSG